MIRFPLARPALLSAAASLMTLTACGSLEGIADNRIDYRGTKVRQTPLDVPPDLTQISTENSRFQPQGGTISATNFNTTPAVTAPPSTGNVAVQSAGSFRLERAGNSRWLVTALPPEQLWPQLKAFFTERGLSLVVDQPDVGVMETEWAENRAKLSNDIVRRTLGKVFDSLYSTGELDKYRVRVERAPGGGSEIYLSHKGMHEVYSGQTKETTVWEARPREPELEAAMLSRIMLKLGASPEQAQAVEASAGTPAAAATPSTPARARVLTGRPAASLEVDDDFDRAWRRVGLALDRSGFTVEDRDRAQGVYFVRYVDPAEAGKEEPGFFSRLFTSKKGPTGPVRYRVQVKAEGAGTVVSVLDAQGGPESGEAGQRIVELLVNDLR